MGNWNTGAKLDNFCFKGLQTTWITCSYSFESSDGYKINSLELLVNVFVDIIALHIFSLQKYGNGKIWCDKCGSR